MSVRDKTLQEFLVLIEKHLQTKTNWGRNQLLTDLNKLAHDYASTFGKAGSVKKPPIHVPSSRQEMFAGVNKKQRLSKEQEEMIEKQFDKVVGKNVRNFIEDIDDLPF